MFPVTTDSITNNAQEQPSQSPRYFTTQLTAVPREVSHQSAEESEQAVSMGKDLMPSLHWSIIKCMQIQNYLHKLVLLKLGRKALRSEGHTETLVLIHQRPAMQKALMRIQMMIQGTYCVSLRIL